VSSDPSESSPSGAGGVLAVVCSVAATVCLALLVPVLYLAVDQMASLGQPPTGLLATIPRIEGHWTSPAIKPALEWVTGWNGWACTSDGLLAQLAVIAVALLVARIGLQNAAAHLAGTAAIEDARLLRRDVYNHCYRLGSLAIDSDEQADVGKLITDKIEAIQDGEIAARTTIPRVVSLLGVAAAVLLMVHLWVGLAVLFLGGLVWLIAGQSAAWFRRDARVAERRSAMQMAVMRESLRLMLLVKCYLMERFSQTRVERQLTDLAKTARRQHRGETLSRPTLFTVAAITGVLVLYVAARVVIGGQLSLAGLAVQVACGVAVGVGTLRWIAANVKVRKGKSAEEEVDEFFERRTDAGQPITAKFLQPLARKLELLEVSYREPGSGRMILEQVSASIPAGKRTAVLCADPDEARTFAFLLTRFLEPTGGEIRYDGENTRWVTFDSLRTQVAMVLADHTTFTDTVANNIGCGDSFTRPQIVDAAKLAHAHGFVQQLPNGYETVIGGGGVSLRPGERFRIALARAVLRDPAVLVIEEPTEPFDPDSAALIDDTITRLQAGRTIIILARRSSTVKKADNVVVIQEGKVAGAGEYDGTASASQTHKALGRRAEATK
jgi:ABC-type multidrug transport system fused ATPase/permease subunit